MNLNLEVLPDHLLCRLKEWSPVILRRLEIAIDAELKNSKSKRIILDLTDLTLLSSEGLVLLMALQSRLKDSSRELYLVEPTGLHREILERTGLKRQFSFVDPVPSP